MPYLIVIAYIVGVVLGLVILFLIIREGVKEGILAADKIINKAKKGQNDGGIS